MRRSALVRTGPRLAGLLLVLAPALSPAPASIDTSRPPRVAVLPLSNLTGSGISLATVDETFRRSLSSAGFDIVPHEDVRSFLTSRRIRYTGGIDLAAANAARVDLGAAAVVVGTVDLWVDAPPPRFAMSARLVRSSDGVVLWADAIAAAGEDRPGALGLGEVSEIDRLVASVCRRMVRSVGERIDAAAGGAGLESVAARWDHEKPRRAFRPRRVFADSTWERPAGGRAAVAIVPFEHLGLPEENGLSLAELFAVHLAGRPGLHVLEPGRVREVLIRQRIIQDSGLSLAQADVLRVDLQADLAVTGEVLGWDDRGRDGVARVKFSLRVIDTRRRAIVWSCLSTNRADDGPTLFDSRKPRSARALAAEMARAAASALDRWTRARPLPETGEPTDLAD